MMRFWRRRPPRRRPSRRVSPGALYLLSQWHTGGDIDDDEWRYREHLLRGCPAHRTAGMTIQLRTVLGRSECDW